MGEKSQQESYITEVANSDNNKEVSSTEQVALDFLKEQKGRLPEKQFQRLLDSTLLILKRQGIEKDVIRTECEKELQKLLSSMDKENKIMNTEDFILQKLDIGKEANISSTLIEEKIKMCDVNILTEISNFLLQNFNDTDGFCPSIFKNTMPIIILHQLLNKIQIDKQKELIHTKLKTWLKSKGKTDDEAQKIIEEIERNAGNDEMVCNTSLLKNILGVLEAHGIKDINYTDKGSLVDFIRGTVAVEETKNTGKLQSIALQFGISQEELNTIKTEADVLRLASSKHLDPEETQQLLQTLERQGQIHKQKEHVDVLEKTNVREFTYLIHTLQSWGDPRDTMQEVKRMQEERINLEQKNMNGIIKEAYKPIGDLETGETNTYHLSRENPDQNTIQITNMGHGLYEVWVSAHEKVQLTQRETEWYLASFRFLEDTGLGYLVRAIRPDRLSYILSLSSRDGRRVNNKDGDFTDYEWFRFLRTLGWVLQIPDIDQAINFEQAETLFHKTFCREGDMIDGWFEKMACNIGLIRNGSLRIDELERLMKVD